VQIHPAASVNVVQSAATAAAEVALSGVAAEYNTTAGGKNYSAAVEQAGSEYSARVANLPEAAASGATVPVVENRLSALISFFA
jgi:hypothetical protein